MFLDRYTVFISPAFYLLVGFSADAFKKPRHLGAITGAAAIFLIMATFTPDVDNKRRLKEAVSVIRQLKSPGTVVIICPSWLKYGFTYHYSGEYFRDYASMTRHLNREDIFPVNSWEELDTNLVNRASSVVYFEEWATLVDPGNRIYNELRKRFRFPDDRAVYENFRIHRFGR